jgi:hypothetical protein
MDTMETLSVQQIKQRITELEKKYTDAAIYLPLYDQRQCAQVSAFHRCLAYAVESLMRVVEAGGGSGWSLLSCGFHRRRVGISLRRKRAVVSATHGWHTNANHIYLQPRISD